MGDLSQMYSYAGMVGYLAQRLTVGHRQDCLCVPSREFAMKRALGCGAGGFIAGHRLRQGDKETGGQGDFTLSPPLPLTLSQLGGMGFISIAECEVLHNNALINIHMTHTAAEMGVSRYFFSSSVCIYRNMESDEPPLTEDDAIPANPDNEYGWEKLYAERVAMAYGRRYPMKVRIARFENCCGPEGTWRGGREKAPAAICRKVAEAEACTEQSECDGGTIEVWGDGTAVRVFTYVDDLVDGIYTCLLYTSPSPRD